ncbi:hypothetical protein F4815DRAFT_483652 [Daldinia loculata]|nr:hypothetical protein F4815DRAFT_483652 [Daldinia loculata]
MLDQASPCKGMPISQAIVARYYMGRRQFKRQGNDGNPVDDQYDSAKRASCGVGKLLSNRYEKCRWRWGLDTLTIKQHIKDKILQFYLIVYRRRHDARGLRKQP